MYREPAETDRDLLITAFHGRVLALERATGHVRWEVVLAQGGHVDLHVGHTTVLTATAQNLVFLDYATGAVRRVIELTTDSVARRPVVLVDGERLFVGYAGELRCYTQDGELVWTRPFTGSGFSALALGFPGNVRQADDFGMK